MGPLASALFVGASLAISAYSNKQQARVEDASNRLQVEQARLQTAEAALQRTEAFRISASNQLALSGMGVGGTTALASTINQSLSNYGSDISALNQQSDFISLSGEANRALSKSKRFQNNLNTVMNSATLAQQLGIFEAKIKGKK